MNKKNREKSRIRHDHNLGFSIGLQTKFQQSQKIPTKMFDWYRKQQRKTKRRNNIGK
jgi:hypothetical protein